MQVHAAPRPNFTKFPKLVLAGVWVVVTVTLIISKWETQPLPYIVGELEAIWAADPSTTHHCAPFSFTPGGENLEAVWSNQSYLFDGQWHTTLSVFDRAEQLVATRSFPWPIHHVVARDVDGDKLNEFVIAWQDSNRSGIRVLRWPEFAFVCDYVLEEPDSQATPTRRWDTGLTIGPVVLNGTTGRRQLLVIVRAGHCRYPRGIHAIDGSLGFLYWRHDIAASPSNIDTADVNGDGISEILLGSTGVANGARINGTSDDSCYLELLKADSTLLWRKPWSGRYPAIIPYFSRRAMADRNSQPEIIAFQQSPGSDSPPNRLLRFDAETGTELSATPVPGHGGSIEIFPWHFFETKPVCYMVGHGADEAGVYSSRATRAAPNLKLRTIRTAADFNNDGIQELIAREPDGATVVLDTTFNVIARWDKAAATFDLQNASASNATAWVGGAWGVSRINIVPNPRFATWKLTELLKALAWLSLGLLTASLVALLVTLDRQRAHAQTSMKQEQQERQKLDIVIHKLDHDRSTVFKAFPSMLEALADNPGIPASIVSRLLTLKEGFTQRQTDIQSETRAIRRVLTQAPDMKLVELSEIVTVTLKPLAADRPHVQLAIVLEPPIHIRGDAEIIKSVFRKLFMNCCEHPRTATPLQIIVQQAKPVAQNLVETEGLWINIAIRDNGSGIPTSNLNHIFNLGFTSREDREDGQSRGFGLFFVAEALRAHGGAVRVESVVGEGTTFYLRFPLIRS
jgi:signal transduction histidine kinase